LTVLHTFAGSPNDGANPLGDLILSGNTLYGVTLQGGPGFVVGAGSVFKADISGSSFTNLYFFSATNGWGPGYLSLSGDTLYGVTGLGGTNSSGVLFALSTNGSGFTDLYTFGPQTYNQNLEETNANGAGPDCLAICSNTLYVTVSAGTTNTAGAVFSLNTNGTNLTNVCDFPAGTAGNVIGGAIGPKIILSGNTLFGTTIGNSYYPPGGQPITSYGGIFRVDTDGSSFTNLYTFTNGEDGSMPVAAVTLAGNILYGTAATGGSGSNGTVFSIHTDGSGFTTLHAFANSDGCIPWCALTLSGNALYGATAEGGSSGAGTLFRINTDGSGFTNLYVFTALQGQANSDGASPEANLILCGNTLYGIATQGGESGWGTLFAFSLPLPQLGIASVNGQQIISWPGWAANFNLQKASTFCGNWTDVTNGVTSSGENYTVTLNTASPTVFFRLALR
jgi:uncharacterized repeat protein (TIGR03803 family)